MLCLLQLFVFHFTKLQPIWHGITRYVIERKKKEKRQIFNANHINNLRKVTSLIIIKPLCSKVQVHLRHFFLSTVARVHTKLRKNIKKLGPTAGIANFLAAPVYRTSCPLENCNFPLKLSPRWVIRFFGQKNNFFC